MAEYNEVTKPAHYDWATVGGISALEAFSDTSYVFGCGMKYILRYPKKNQFQDVQKALFLFDHMVREVVHVQHSIHGYATFQWWVRQLVEDARDQLTAMQRQIFGLLVDSLDYSEDGGRVSRRVIRAIRDLLRHYVDLPVDTIPAYKAGSTPHSNIFELILPTTTKDLTSKLLTRDRLLDVDRIDPVAEQWVVSHPIYRTDQALWPVPADADDHLFHARSEYLGGQL